MWRESGSSVMSGGSSTCNLNLHQSNMSTEFHYKIKKLEEFIAGGMWKRAEEELHSAYVLQPTNPYLAAYAQRLASLTGSPVSGDPFVSRPSNVARS